MSGNAQAAVNPQPAPQQNQGGGFFGNGIMQQILQFFLMYYAMSYFMNQWRGGGDTTTQSDPQNRILPYSPFWHQHTKYNLRIYLNDHSLFDLSNINEQHLIFTHENIDFSCDDISYFDTDLEIDINQSSNISLFAHIIIHEIGYPYEQNDADFDPHFILLMTHPMIKYKRKKKKSTSNLWSSNTSSTKQSLTIGHWKPELTLRPLCNWQTFQSIQSPMNNYYMIDEETHKYWPVLYLDDFWLLNNRYIPLNVTVEKVPLKIIHSPISNWKFTLQLQMALSFKKQKENSWSKLAKMFTNETMDENGEQFEVDEDEEDEIRRILLESNPYLLGMTGIVFVLHMIFSCLAFKNDIQFWRKTESVKGLSVRTIFINCFCQIIIFLYLVDQNTTYMVLFTTGVGCLIEFWKVTQAAHVSFGLKGNRAFNGPWIMIEDRDSYVMSDTAKYDKQAMKYLSYVMYPMLFVYCLYSLMYNEHKGWYSFVIGTLVSFMYVFGFILMCPQLYLNYKLQSVAHLPWRMMSYKFLNTIIDDLFAFLITMPWLHRLSCFRDDVIFLIFLYQKWIYRTDYSRVNEYGYKMDDGEGSCDGDEEVDSHEKKE